METIDDWNGRSLKVRRSAGTKVAYVEQWEHNVLRPGDQQWPDWLLKQVRGYVAHRSWFSEEDADALAADLGVISKFQSFNSEDAVTWSWFGTLSLSPNDVRRAAVQWLTDFLDLGVRLSPKVRIDQWPRVYHPNEPASPKGPEPRCPRR